MANFKPKWVECVLNTNSFKFECLTPHEVVLEGKKPFSAAKVYRFTGKPLKYLVKNEADYDEMMENVNFRDYVEPSEEPVSEPSETPRAKKLREQKEAKEAKEELKKGKDSKTLKIVPASQTDGVNSIDKRPESD